MIEIKGTTAYPLSLWRAALDVAELAGFCPIDTRENNGGELGALGAWLCDELYGSDQAGQAHGKDSASDVTEQIIDGALAVVDQEDQVNLTPDYLVKVIRSYRGETVADFEELAREHVETDYIGPEDENPANSDWSGFNSERDYERWFVDHATSEGEVCGEVRERGTLIWFDKFQW